MKLTNRFFLPILLAIGLASAPALFAADDEQVEVEINFKELKIEDFLKMVSKITGKNILLTHNVSGNIDFISTSPFYKDELMTFAITILETRGMTLVEEGSYYKIVRVSDAAKENLPIVTKQRATGALMVTQAVQIDLENVDIVVQKVRHLLSPAAKLVTMKETNTMVVTDYPRNIQTVLKVIDAITEDAQVSMEFINLEHVNSEAVHANLSQIIANKYNQRVEKNKVTLLNDKVSNALILLGRKEILDELKALVKRMDVEEDFSSTKVEVIRLENSDATNVSKLLEGILGKTQTADPKNKPTVSADVEMNAIIAVALTEDMDNIKEIVASLDVPRQQVYVKATVIEVIENRARQLGARYGLEGGALSTNALYTLGTTLTGTSVASSLVASSIPSDATSGLAIGVSLAFLQTNGAAEVLSEPSVLCVNNKESEIYVGETKSFITASNTPSTGGTVNSYTRQDIGLTLKVKPRISSGKKVDLQINAQLEGVAASSTAGQPDTTKRRVMTNAIVNDGEAVIIGGLIKAQDDAGKEGLPWFSELPILENIFGVTSTSKSKTSLLVILTPYVVENSDDLANLRTRLTRLDAMQQKFNKEVLGKLDVDPKPEEKEEEGWLW